MRVDTQVRPVPVPVADHDLATDDVPEPATDGEISLLVRVHGIPIGLLGRLPSNDGADTRERAVWTHLRGEIEAHLRADGHQGVATPAAVRATREQCSVAADCTGELVSVVVCSLGQDPRLPRTLRSLLDQTYQPLELIVVDNAPASGRVRRLLQAVDDPRLRVVPEQRRGLSWARNTGLSTARGGIVAFTDDDAFADRDWVRRLVAPFAQDPRVRCSTGLVLPAELATRSQLLFEQYGAFDKGFRRTLWQLGDQACAVSDAVEGRHDGLFPFSPGIFGSGNNMAFDRRWMLQHGGFDTILGAGSTTRSGEDVDAFLAVLLDDQMLVYVPEAVVRHYARPDVDGLRTQVFGYAIGMSATITKHLVGDWAIGRQVLRRLPLGLAKLLDPRSSQHEAKQRDYPRSLTWTEYVGYLIGPTTYLVARLRRRMQSR